MLGTSTKIRMTMCCNAKHKQQSKGHNEIA
jgi:hypothetical protein